MQKGIFIVIFLSILASLVLTFAKPEEFAENTEEPSQVIRDVRLQLDKSNSLIPLEKLEAGCEKKDCIQSIDNPHFESIGEASTWLNDSDRVFVLSQNGESKIFPKKIISWHEVVNDEIASEPVAVTFSPLSGSAIAYERQVDGINTNFGVSGKLYNSNLVIYDRYEGNLWQQFTGQAISGPAVERGETLNQVKLIPLSWMKARDIFSDANVLSRNTGYEINYEDHPYESYDDTAKLIFDADSQDNRLHPKAKVYGIVVNNIAKAYPAQNLEAIKNMRDTVGDQEIDITNENGIINFQVSETHEEIPNLKSYWFSWISFYPDSLL